VDVVTGDQRIRKNLAERAAWIRAGLKAFVLAPVYQKTPINQGASVRVFLVLGSQPDHVDGGFVNTFALAIVIFVVD
jgi:hypothetical protein